LNAGIKTARWVDGIVAAVVDAVDDKTGGQGPMRRIVFLEIRDFPIEQSLVPDTPLQFHHISEPRKEIGYDMGLQYLRETKEIVIQQFLIFDIGVGAEAIGVLRVFIKPIVAQQVKLAVFCPDIGFYGNGELFILRIGGAGGYSGQLGGRIESESHIAGDSSRGLGSQSVPYCGYRGKGWFYDQGIVQFLFRLAFRMENVFEDVGHILLRHALADAGGIVGTTIASRFVRLHLLDLGAQEYRKR
jgi:hypothetical protein